MIPDQPGTYVLILRLRDGVTIRVGSMGDFQFPRGWYAYVGSARGPGGLSARLARHCSLSKTLHWHIDYLRAHARPVCAWYVTGDRSLECAWAGALAGLPGALIPVPRFGASDCRCSGHLVYFANAPEFGAFSRVIGERVVREVWDARW